MCYIVLTICNSKVIAVDNLFSHWFKIIFLLQHNSQTHLVKIPQTLVQCSGKITIREHFPTEDDKSCFYAILSHFYLICSRDFLKLEKDSQTELSLKFQVLSNISQVKWHGQHPWSLTTRICIPQSLTMTHYTKLVCKISR